MPRHSNRKMWAGPLYGVVLLLGVLQGSPPAHAQPAPSASPPPAQVQQLLNLMQDPVVRSWAEEQQRPAPVPAPSEPATATASGAMTQRIAGLQGHLAALAAAVPRLPDEFRNSGHRLLAELQGRRLVAVLVLIAGFLGLGAGTEWLFGRLTTAFRRRAASHPETTVPGRLRVLAMRLGFDVLGVLIFAGGSLGAFLLFDWPPLLQQVVVAYLAAVVLLRLILVAGRFLLAPDCDAPGDIERFRLIPMSTLAARFRQRRLALFVGWFVIGWATVDVLSVLGFSPEARQVVAYILGLGLLAIAIHTVWTRPPGSGAAPEAHASRQGAHVLRAGLLSLCLVLLWGLWVAGLIGLFWLGALALLLPWAIAGAETASRQAARPPAGSSAAGETGLAAVFLGRGLRALLIVGAVLLMAHALKVDLVEMTSRDTLLTRLVRGVLSSVVILLVADLLWQVARTLIDRRLARSEAVAPVGSAAAAHQARLRTLLPIFRNVAFAVLAVVALLMALSALGVEIGPLIAGAGVAGVAIGFGAQTLVKDVISGVFYLLDDAFRVGEYIQSGSYKGTVESFSLRSIKLRHHRGPVYTVPFGELGAVQNMSRDWVIDKFQINLTYDTDLEKARKLIKNIGQDMAADPEFAPHIIEPLKMQGVEQFGDFAIQIRMKMTTRPGEQFVIRRKAYARIKHAFDENGIKFAFPTVQVAGGGDASPAVAHQGLQLVKPAGPAE
jgi:moderate conductance mechanosensitive channel